MNELWKELYGKIDEEVVDKYRVEGTEKGLSQVAWWAAELEDQSKEGKVSTPEVERGLLGWIFSRFRAYSFQ